MNIMCVDDSPTIRKIVSSTFALSDGKFDVIEATNGIDALGKLEVTKIDMFIVDINMPRMNGIEFIEKVREKPEYSSTPIIILTTENTQDMMDKGRAVGANAWMVKPFDHNELFKLIKHFFPDV